MALSKAVISGLFAEIRSLEAQRAQLDERIAAIRTVLSGEGETLAQAKYSTVPPALYAGMTVKAVVASVLRELPGVKAADVTRHLRRVGYTPGGDTRLSHRVYNEIWRMMQTGEVIKNPDGGFTLQPELLKEMTG